MTEQHVASTLMGAVSMASLVAMLFFAKFWRHTRDPFFLFLAAACGVDAVGRFMIGVLPMSSEAEPMAYLPDWSHSD